MLTTGQFQEALARHIDESKPDPLAKHQLERLDLSWEQHDDATNDDGGPSSSTSWSLCGTLTLSSEYVAVALHVTCQCTMDANKEKGEGDGDGGTNAGTNPLRDKHFENEFYLRLTVGASFVASTKGEENIDRKERASKRKLRAGTMKRLRADKLVRRLLDDEEIKGVGNNAPSSKVEGGKQQQQSRKDGVPLCEALIQQSRGSIGRGGTSCTRADGELEERVNVCEGSLEGIRNAILSHCEDNLDVLELLLCMPYLPRSSGSNSSVASATATGPSSGDSLSESSEVKLHALAERAYLRLLEDAMFDACEKEGEDELLDDLNLADDNNRDDDSDRDAAADEDNIISGKGKTEGKLSSKRATASA